MRILLCILLTLVCIPSAFALTCEFTGWDIPKLSENNSIILDNVTWIAIDTNEGDEYTRRIVIESLQGVPPSLDPGISDSFYISESNDFLERNDESLIIESYSELEIEESIEIPKTIDFLGESQYCYNIPIVGTFAGAIEFTDATLYSLTSKWYAPIIIEEIEPEINPEEVGATEEDLVIIKDDDEFKLAWEVEDEDGVKYFDADTGDEIEWKDQVNIPKNKKKVKVKLDGQAILLILMLAVIVFGVAIYYSLQKKE